MHDANDFVRAIQQVSNGVNEAGYPADVMSGTVIAAAPLKIKVEQRFDIASAQLIVPEHLTDRTVDIELDGVKKEMKIYSGLKTGQQVVLIRQQGGQRRAGDALGVQQIPPQTAGQTARLRIILLIVYTMQAINGRGNL